MEEFVKPHEYSWCTGCNTWTLAEKCAAGCEQIKGAPCGGLRITDITLDNWNTLFDLIGPLDVDVVSLFEQVYTAYKESKELLEIPYVLMDRDGEILLTWLGSAAHVELYGGTPTGSSSDGLLIELENVTDILHFNKQ